MVAKKLPPTHEDYLRNERMLSANYRATFNSALGRDVMKDLIARFATEYLCDVHDPYEITVRAAQRDVIMYIQRRLENDISTDMGEEAI